MPVVSFFDTKPYDRTYMLAADEGTISWRFHDFRLNAETARLAAGATIACIFVNDRADRATLTVLKEEGVERLVLRSAGFNHVDLEAAKELGIAVTRVPAYSPHAVAEHTVALLLTLNRNIHRAYNRVRDHNFSLHGLVGFDLYEKTAGLIGLGKIGSIVARILHGFGMKVLAYDPITPPTDLPVEVTTLEDLLSRSDVVSLHAPLTPATHHLLNGDTFTQMKRGATIVNTSRGALINTNALLDALRSGRVGGAALDVYEEEEGIFFEDLSDSILEDDALSLLLTQPNVLVTSHQAFLTHEALTQIARTTVDNIRLAQTKEAVEGTRLV
jgi:D-lactate dehydrogenase